MGTRKFIRGLLLAVLISISVNDRGSYGSSKSGRRFFMVCFERGQKERARPTKQGYEGQRQSCCPIYLWKIGQQFTCKVLAIMSTYGKYGRMSAGI